MIHRINLLRLRKTAKLTCVDYHFKQHYADIAEDSPKYLLALFPNIAKLSLIYPNLVFLLDSSHTEISSFTA